MSSVPIRNVVLTAAGASLEEIMAAVYADIPNGTWTQVTQTTTTTPAVAATGTLGVIIPTNPSPGATITVNGATLTPAGGPRGVGTSAHNYNDQLLTAAAISADIVAAWSDPSNFFFGAISDCTASDLTGSVLFTANTLGTGGNGYVFTSTDGTNYPVTGSGFLTGGTDAVPGPSGARSFAIRSPDTTIELNMIWASTTQAVLGINPDGVSDPITDSSAPWSSAANFSDDGAPGGLPVDIGTPENAEFILLEWPDAIMIITKNSARTTSFGAFHWGKIWHQPLTGLESTAEGIRLDGFAAVPGQCRRGNTVKDWVSTNAAAPTNCLRRESLGQGTHTNPDFFGPAFAWQNGEWTANQNVTTDASYTYSGQRIAGPLVYSLDTDKASDCWIWKYVRRVGQLKAPFLLYSVGAVETYMTLNYVSTSNCDLTVLIRDNFVPNP